jgi:hypothetical protein
MIFGDCGLPALRRLGEGGRIGRKKAQKAQKIAGLGMIGAGNCGLPKDGD